MPRPDAGDEGTASCESPRGHPQQGENTMKSLVGKFAFYDEGETYQTGEIVAAASPDAYLIKFDSYGDGDAPLPMEVVSVEEMAAMVNHGPNCNCHQKAWRFFETRAEME